MVESNAHSNTLISKKENLVAQERTIQKSGAPERMRIEVKKTIRGRRIGLATGLFRVPEVLEYDEDRGVAIFERLRHLCSIRQALTFGSDYRGLTERTARSLAAIHNLLQLPEEMAIPLPTELRAEGSGVVLHGDFSFNNVCIDTESNAIVILDWQMTKIHGGEATYGTPFFDVAWFINNLFNRYLHHCLFSNSAVEIARCFLHTYVEAARAEFNMTAYETYLTRFLAITNCRRRRQWPLSQRIMLVAFNHFWKRHILTLEN